MKKKAIMFLDYNGTFDDIGERKGHVFFASLEKFIKHYKGNVEIAVITSAQVSLTNSIREDVIFTLSYFPPIIRDKFHYLIEDSCQYLWNIDCKNFSGNTENEILSQNTGTKKDGIEIFMRKIDPNDEIKTCIFAGDNENNDLLMMDADIGEREKIFVLANKRLIKTNYPIYKLSLRKDLINDIGNEILNFRKNETSPFIIKTSCNSYGVGKGIDAAVCFLNEKER